MAYSNIKTKNLINKFPSDLADNYNEWKAGYFCIPLIPTNGFITNTENGQFGMVDIDVQYNTWKELIAYGNGDIQVVWDEAVIGSSSKTNIVNVNYDGTTNPIDLYNKSVITYKVGKYFWGFNSEETNGFSIESDPSYNGFNTITQNESFSLLVPARCANDCDFNLFRFYTFPEITKKIFLISNITTHRDPNDNQKIISYEIEFEHIGNKLQKSGKSIEEYIHYSPIGGGFPFPVIDRNNKTISLNDDLIKINGVNNVNEEIYNACVQCATVYYGWRVVEHEIGLEDELVGTITQPVKNADGTYTQHIQQPTAIFPCDYTLGESNLLNKKAIPDDDFTIINDVVLSEDRWTDWVKLKTEQITQDFDSKYQGELSFSSITDHSSISVNDFSDRNKSFNINISSAYSLSAYVENDLSSFNSITLQDLNLFNYYTLLDVEVLPWTFNLHNPLLVSQWAYVGGIFNKICGGIPLGADRRTLFNGSNTITKNISGIVNTAFLNSATKDWNTSSANNDNVFLQYFFGKDTADHFNSNNRTMSMKYYLTDIISKTFQPATADTEQTYNEQVIGKLSAPTTFNFRTGLLGQDYVPKSFGSEWDNTSKNNEIYATRSETAALLKQELSLDGTEKVVSPFNINRIKYDKFVICGYSNKNIGGQSIKLSFNSDDKKIWQGAFETDSNFRDSTREWTNKFIINYFNAINLGNQSIEYPKQVEYNLIGDVNNEEVLFGDYEMLKNNDNKINGEYSYGWYHGGTKGNDWYSPYAFAPISISNVSYDYLVDSYDNVKLILNTTHIEGSMRYGHFSMEQKVDDNKLNNFSKIINYNYENSYTILNNKISANGYSNTLKLNYGFVQFGKDWDVYWILGFIHDGHSEDNAISYDGNQNNILIPYQFGLSQTDCVKIDSTDNTVSYICEYSGNNTIPTTNNCKHRYQSDNATNDFHMTMRDYESSSLPILTAEHIFYDYNDTQTPGKKENASTFKFYFKIDIKKISDTNTAVFYSIPADDTYTDIDTQKTITTNSHAKTFQIATVDENKFGVISEPMYFTFNAGYKNSDGQNAKDAFKWDFELHSIMFQKTGGN